MYYRIISMLDMSYNIGSKIKSLAKAFCWIGVIASIFTGISLMSDGEEVGLLVLLFGSLFSWIGSFSTYGFGELIEKTSEIAENTRPRTKREPVVEQD